MKNVNHKWEGGKKERKEKKRKKRAKVNKSRQKSFLKSIIFRQ